MRLGNVDDVHVSQRAMAADDPHGVPTRHRRAIDRDERRALETRLAGAIDRYRVLDVRQGRCQPIVCGPPPPISNVMYRDRH